MFIGVWSLLACLAGFTEAYGQATKTGSGASSGKPAIRPAASKPFEGVVEYALTYKGEFGEQFAHLLPKRLVLYFQGDSLLTETRGPLSQYAWKNLHIAGNDTIWSWNDSLRQMQYTLRTSYQRLFPFSDTSVKLMPQGETILGYATRQYRTKVRNRFGKVQLRIWTSTATGISLRRFGQNAPAGLYFYTMKIPGFPLKIIQYMVGLDLLSQATARSLKAQRVPDKVFARPTGYTIEAFDAGAEVAPLPEGAGGR
jgi:hypothetical protein